MWQDALDQIAADCPTQQGGLSLVGARELPLMVCSVSSFAVPSRAGAVPKNLSKSCRLELKLKKNVICYVLSRISL